MLRLLNTIFGLLADNPVRNSLFSKVRLYSQCCVAALLTVSASASYGQSSSAASDREAGPGILEEIFVTAQRRNESASTVAISVSAFSGGELEKRGITNANELQALVPGVTMITTNSTNEFDWAIRGQTLQQYSGSAPAVLSYLNDVPLSPHNTSGSALYDLEGIEVLKGPQGTLFGRNNTGGAVLLKSVMPGDELEGYFKVGGGSYDKINVEGAVTIPVSPQFSLRIAGNYQEEDGYITNILTDRTIPSDIAAVVGNTSATNPPNTTLGDVDNKSVRVSAKFTPSDALTSTFVFQYDEAGGTTGVPQIFSHYVTGQTFNGNNLTTLTDGFTGGAQQIYAARAQQNPFEEYLVYTGPHKSESFFISSSTTYDLSPTTQVKGIFSYNESDSIVSNQLNASPFLILADLHANECCDGLNYVQENWSAELQLIGEAADSRLNYIIGGFISSNDATNLWPFYFGGFSFHWRYKTGDISKALYSQATYQMSDRLSATVGLRYTWEELSADQLAGGINTFPGNVLNQNKDDASPSWQVGLDYAMTDEVFLYAVTRGSWRAGGYNNGTAGADGQGNQFDKETTQDVEIGLKYDGLLGGRSFRATVAAFVQWNQDYQATLYILSGGNPSAAPVNIADARTFGIELSADLAVTDRLRIGGAAAYNDAKFTDGTVSSGAGLTGSVDNFANTPDFSASTYVTYDLPVPENWGVMSLRADTYSVTKRPFSNFTQSIIPFSTLPGYTTVNMRADWENVMGSDISLAVYGRNIFDDFYWLGGFPLGFIQGTNTAIPAQPATWGVEASYRF